MTMYDQFKATVLGKKLTEVQGITDPYGVQCVVLDWAYADFLYPNVSIQQDISTGNAKTIFANANPAYFDKIANNHNDPNQLPEKGDIMVFDATPEAGFSNQFANPDGHTGICDSATSAGYFLLEQNAPASGEGVNVSERAWKYDPCIGWLRPKVIETSPAPAPVPTSKTPKTIHYAQTIGPVHLYDVGGPYTPSKAKAVLIPANFKGGITEQIVAYRGNGIYTIKTADFGEGDVWTNGTDIVLGY